MAQPTKEKARQLKFTTTSMRITAPERDSLRRAAAEQGVTISEVIRASLRATGALPQEVGA